MKPRRSQRVKRFVPPEKNRSGFVRGHARMRVNEELVVLDDKDMEDEADAEAESEKLPPAPPAGLPAERPWRTPVTPRITTCLTASISVPKAGPFLEDSCKDPA